MTYTIFTRTWWKHNPDWPDNKEPCIGSKTIINYADTEEEARAICKEYNDTHDPGRLSKKAEYTSD